MEPATPAAPTPLASWGQRVAAILIDSLIVIVPAGIALALLVAGGAAAVIGLVLFFVIITVGQALYFTVLNGNDRGQTCGKRALGIRVVDVETGGPIGYGRSLARWGVPTVINLIVGIFSIVDGLWPLWDARNQALHDKFANSIVVRVQN